MTFPVHLRNAPHDLKIGIRAFWPADEWEAAANIAWLESAWNRLAWYDSTTAAHPCGSSLPPIGGVAVTAERSVGYFQINSCNFPEWDPASLLDAYQNCGTAHMLWVDAGGSWAPWYFSAEKLSLP